jgi:hypothetical protein
MVYLPNFALCCEINTCINDIIVQQSIILICKTLKHLCNSNKRIKKYYINDKISKKFYTFKEEPIKNILPYQDFQFFSSSWNLDKMIFKCSLIHYGMIVLMIMIFLG